MGRYRYIAYNTQANRMYFVLPVSRGEELALDNTCQVASAFKSFLGTGFGGDCGQAIREGEHLQRYLQHEQIYTLFLGREFSELQQQMLDAVQHYLYGIQHVQESDVRTQILAVNFPARPEAVQKLLADSTKSNVFSMHLRPQEMDHYVTTAPTFAMSRSLVWDNPFVNRLRDMLRSTLQKGRPVTSSRSFERIKEDALVFSREKFACDSVDQACLVALRDALETLYANGLAGPLCLQYTDYDGAEITVALIREIYGYAESEPLSVAAAASALFELAYQSGDLLSATGSTPFEILSALPQETERQCIAKRKHYVNWVQFFLGEINLFCCAYRLVPRKTNMGIAFEKNWSLREALVKAIQQALETQGAMEEAIFTVMNAHYAALMLKQPLSTEVCQAIQKKFGQHFTTIFTASSSPDEHYDDFSILYPERPGTFFCHQGLICCLFDAFMQTAFPRYDPVFFRAQLAASQHDQQSHFSLEALEKKTYAADWDDEAVWQRFQAGTYDRDAAHKILWTPISKHTVYWMRLLTQYTSLEYRAGCGPATHWADALAMQSQQVLALLFREYRQVQFVLQSTHFSLLQKQALLAELSADGLLRSLLRTPQQIAYCLQRLPDQCVRQVLGKAVYDFLIVKRQLLMAVQESHPKYSALREAATPKALHDITRGHRHCLLWHTEPPRTERHLCQLEEERRHNSIT